MSRPRSTNGVFLIVAAAAVGILLVYVPPKVLEQYERIKQLGPPWIYFYVALVGTGLAILVTLSCLIVIKLWRETRRKEAQQSRSAKDPSELSAAEKQQEVTDNLAAVDDLGQGGEFSADVKRRLQDLVAGVEQKRASQKLEIVAFGAISSGKSSLLNALADRDAFATDPRGGTTQERLELPWPGDDRVLLVDTPGLGEVEGAERVAVAAQAARDADLVLLVVDGPLRESEHQLLVKLGEMQKRIFVCLNKADWYGDDERRLLLGQISSQVHDCVPPEDILAVRAQPTVRTRVRVLAGGEQEEQVPVPADISPLARRMVEVVHEEGPDLLLANLLMRSRGLIEEAKQQARQSLDRRAWEIVERYTWASGAAAALSPLPLLDLFASSALTVKMVLDLARVYRQQVDVDLAVNMLAQLGKNLIAILGVNALAPAVTAAVASLLKTVPIAGTIAGGALQGIVQALVTRWIGAVFIGYFQAEMQLPPEGLANLARREWQRLTSPAELLKIIQQARDRFRGAS